MGAAEAHLAPLVAAVENALEDLSPAKLWVGYSGGIDSTALLHAAVEVARSARVPIAALHAHHGLSDQADAWVAHCEHVCSQLGIECVVGRIEVAREGSLEANARAVRYAFFAEHAEPADALLLAHHLDDQTETRLLRLFQGRGMVGMAPVSQRDGLTIVRPLLEFSKPRLKALAEASRLAWVEDDSNLDVRHDRNYLRHEIIPRIAARWPQLDQSVARVGEALDVLKGMGSAQMMFGAEPYFRQEDLNEAGGGRLRLRWLVERSGFSGIADRALDEFLTQVGRGDRARLALDEHHDLVLKDGVVRVHRLTRNSL